jgi:hypothetical protein
MSRIMRYLSFGVGALAVASLATAAPQTTTATPSHRQAAQSAKDQSGSMSGKSAKSAASTTLAASGKIVRFDPAAQSLTLSTSKGEKEFTIDSSTRLRDASHTISANDLAKLTGHQATVRYHESDGQKQILSVRVVTAPAKTQAKR